MTTALLIVLVVPLGLALVAFWLWMLVDCLRAESESPQERLTWALVLIFLKLIGAAIYYFYRYRPRHAAAH